MVKIARPGRGQRTGQTIEEIDVPPDFEPIFTADALADTALKAAELTEDQRDQLESIAITLADTKILVGFLRGGLTSNIATAAYDADDPAPEPFTTAQHRRAWINQAWNFLDGLDG